MPRLGNKAETERLGTMLNQYLKYRALTTPPTTTGRHLDEDMLAAFVEGALTEREAQPMVKHLVACAACRHTTVSLIQLAAEFDPTPHSVPTPITEPGAFRRFLEQLRARVLNFNAETEVVFAYHETDTPENNAASQPPTKSE